MLLRIQTPMHAARVILLLLVSSLVINPAAASLCENYASELECRGQVVSTGACDWDGSSCHSTGTLPSGTVGITSIIDEPSPIPTPSPSPVPSPVPKKSPSATTKASTTTKKATSKKDKTSGKNKVSGRKMAAGDKNTGK